MCKFSICSCEERAGGKGTGVTGMKSARVALKSLPLGPSSRATREQRVLCRKRARRIWSSTGWKITASLADPLLSLSSSSYCTDTWRVTYLGFWTGNRCAETVQVVAFCYSLPLVFVHSKPPASSPSPSGCAWFWAFHQRAYGGLFGAAAAAHVCVARKSGRSSLMQKS